MKSSIAFLLLVFISVQTAFSQQTNNKKPQKQKSTKTRVKEKGYKLNATIELGFLGVFDHNPDSWAQGLRILGIHSYEFL